MMDLSFSLHSIARGLKIAVALNQKNSSPKITFVHYTTLSLYLYAASMLVENRVKFLADLPCGGASQVVILKIFSLFA